MALVAVFVVSGGTVALSNLACTAHLFAFVPDEGRAFFLSFSSLMLNIGPALALLVTGAVLKGTGDAYDIAAFGATVDVFQAMLVVASLLALGTTPLLRRVFKAS